MGIDDRDYMRDRYRKRQRSATGDVRWNDRKSRVERDGKADANGSWFASKNQGFDNQKDRWRGRRGAKARLTWAGKLILPLVLLTYGIRMYTDAKRWDFLPDLSQSEPFPASGEFKVRRAYASTGTRLLTVIASDSKAVVQLLNNRSEPIFATYVRENELAAVQVPRGKWTIRLIEVKSWRGEEEFFGASTVTEDVITKMDLTENDRIIDLRRRFDGNLKTVNRWSDPTF